MKELSLNILDIAKNSVKANATQVEILLEETDATLKITIRDNGCGMTQDFLKTVENPFSTTRTTRSVGMGIPLFKLAAEQSGGWFKIESTSDTVDSVNHGTTTTAFFRKDSIDFTPLGDIVSTIVLLIQGSPSIRWIFSHRAGENEVSLDTGELKEVLGDVPLDTYEVLEWIIDSLREEYSALNTGLTG